MSGVTQPWIAFRPGHFLILPLNMLPLLRPNIFRIDMNASLLRDMRSRVTSSPLPQQLKSRLCLGVDILFWVL